MMIKYRFIPQVLKHEKYFLIQLCSGVDAIEGLVNL